MKKSIIPFFAIVSLLVVSMSFSQEPGFEFVGSALHNDVYEIRSKEDYLLYSAGSRLIIADKSHYTELLEISSCYALGFIYSFDVEEDYVYVCCGEFGITIIDISNPYFPFVVHNLDIVCEACIVHNNHIYTDEGKVYYVSETYEPNLISEFSNPRYFTIIDNYLYTSRYLTSSGYFSVYDISIPTDIALIDTCSIIQCNHFCIKNNYAYLISEGNNLNIINIANPESCFVENVLCDEDNYFDRVYENSGYLYISNNDEYISIFDVSDPIYPENVGRIFSGTSYSSSIRMCFDSNIAFFFLKEISDIFITIIDISDPSFPEALSVFDLVCYINKVDIVNENIAVDYGDHFSIFDISNLNDIDKIYDRSYASSTYIKDTILVVCGSGIELYNISNPESPLLIGEYDDITGFSNIDIDGEILYGIASNSLMILDFSTPDSIYFVGSYEPLRWSKGIQVENDYCFIEVTDSLLVIDVSDPSYPEYVTEYCFEFHSYDFEVKDTVLFVSSGTEGFKVFNIRDIDSRVEINSIDEVNCSFCLYNNRIYSVVDYLGSNGIIEVSVEHLPELPIISFTQTPEVRGVTECIIDESYCYCYGYISCVNVYRKLESEIDENLETPDSYCLYAYPNPFNSSINIEADGYIEIYNTSGQLVDSFISGGTFTWSPKKLDSGVYLIKSKNKQITQKVVYLK